MGSVRRRAHDLESRAALPGIADSQDRRLVLIDPGDPVIVELPTYSGAIAAFHNLQASLAGVPQDAEGISVPDVERVAADLRKQGGPAKFVYVTPNFQNPAGSLMSARRRGE